MLIVDDICQALVRIAPLHLAQEWDNVGLLAGDQAAECNSILLTIDLTAEVLEEAIDNNIDLVMSYHPPLFKAVSTIRAQSKGSDALIWQAIRQGISIYSMHTALDAAEGGTSDVLADMCGAMDLKPFEYVEENKQECKVVVFVPSVNVDAVAEAMSQAGAGEIGAYSRCSFRIPGRGTFLGDQSTNPTIGKSGQYETVDEVRLEMIVSQAQVPTVVEALREAHTYEEPAFDIYPLSPKPHKGLGRTGKLSLPTTVANLVKRLRDGTPTESPQVVGEPQAKIDKVSVLVGAAGSTPLRLGLGPGDCLVTGEIRHHDALAIQRLGTAAIALGHWASERPVLPRLQQRLNQDLPELQVVISRADRDPLRPIS